MFSYPMTDPWCWYINANMTGVSLDGIHVTKQMAAPWIRHGYYFIPSSRGISTWNPKTMDPSSDDNAARGLDFWVLCPCPSNSSDNLG